MAFLPIVERELRLASRRKNIYRVRIATTSVAVIVSLIFFAGNVAPFGVLPGLGPKLFSLLTYYTFGLSLLAGVFLAADCISQEKREGTLGLLFLADITSRDIILGKLVTVGLSALFGLVAVLPVTALPLLLGGVTASEYWRTAFALVNALFYSLALGILVSTCSRDGGRARGNTMGLVFLLTVVLPIAGFFISFFHLPSSWSYLFAISPYYPIAQASIGSFRSYVLYLMTSNAFAWGMLFAATWSLPRVWQDKPVVQKQRAVAVFGRDAGAETRCRARRAWILDQNPILWLVVKESRIRWGAWAVAVIAVMFSMVALIFLDAGTWDIWMPFYVMIVLGFILKVFAASEACRFFVDIRRSGGLELILATPLSSREIIRGQWLALMRMFGGPLILFLLADVAVSIQPMLHPKVLATFGMGLNNSPFGPWMWSPNSPLILVRLGALAYQLVKLAADLAAVGWMGMWLALSMKRFALAPILNILLVVVFPTFFFCAPSAVFDLFFILWAREQVINGFREAAMPEYKTSRQTLVPLPDVPPVISR